MQEEFLNSLDGILYDIKRRNPSFDEIDGLKKLILEILRKYKPKAIIIAGSLAEGKWIRGMSDIDILVITDAVRGEKLTMRSFITSINEVDAQVSMFTEEEVLMGMDNLNFFFISAIYYGIPVYGSECYQRLKMHLEKMISERKIKRTEYGWVFE
ncbi:MAG: nucleotidyltransferase domain-containing protein [Candidatus Baldrarchaeia archaeon]